MAPPPPVPKGSPAGDPAHRIAVVVPRYGLMGGAENFVFELTERLAREPGFRLHVLANRWRAGSSRICFHKIPIWPFPRWVRPVSFAAAAQRVLRAGHFDLVHSHERIFGCHLFTFHGIPHRTWVRKVRNKSMSLFDHATDRIERRGIRHPGLQLLMPVSGLAREELLHAYPSVASRSEVQHPGIADRRFRPNDKTIRRNRLRRRLGLQHTDVLLLFVGMNFEVKRLQAVLEGLRDLVSRGHRAIHLAVVGKGAIGRYRRMAAEMGVGSRVHFAGAVEDPTDHYLAADAFTMPSIYDTFGISVLEAMAAGLPVVISERVGAKDLVEAGTSGFVLPEPVTGLRLAEAFEVLADAVTRKRMGDAAREAAARQSWDRIAERTVVRYRSLLSVLSG